MPRDGAINCRNTGNLFGVGSIEQIVTHVTARSRGNFAAVALNSWGRMSDLVTSKRDRIWPVAMIVLGLSVTAAWIGLLGYGLVKLIESAI